MSLKEDLRKWFNPSHPEGGWKRINSKGEAIGPCAREPGEPKPKCMSNEKRASLSKKERASAVAAKRRHDPVADRSGKGGKPVNVSNFGKGKLSEEMEQLDEKNVPTNPSLWSRAKSLARSKFDVYPSAYANGWAAKWYKSKGGGWKSVSEEVELDEAMGKIKVNVKDSKPSAADRMYALQQSIRMQKGLPDPSDYKKRAAEKQKEIDAMRNEPPHGREEGKFMSGPGKPVKRVQSQATPRVNKETELDEGDKMLVQNRSGGRMTVFKKFKDIYKKHGYSPVPGTRNINESDDVKADQVSTDNQKFPKKMSRKAKIVRDIAKEKSDQFQANPILDSDVNPQTNKQ